MKVREILMSIKETAGTLAKKQILKDNINDVIKNIFEDTYSDRKYHVKKYNVREIGFLTIDEYYSEFRAVLDALSERKITGNEAKALVESVIGSFVPEDQWILNGIMSKNLKIGISKDNFNDVCGNAIENFEVALAYNLEKVKGVDVLDGTYLASRKCDGARCIAFVDTIENKITFKSRQGKEFKTLDNLKNPLLATIRQCGFGPNVYVIDGEICILDENGDEHFNWIMREITRKDHTIKNPHYKIFDILTYDEFTLKEISASFSIRYEMLKSIFVDCDWYSVLEQERITCQEDFDRWTQKASDDEWEGFMLRKDVPYESGRTKDLLKVKKFQDAEYIVKDVVMGKATYNEGGSKEYDIVSALVIEHKGNTVEVGSGLSKDQRISWYSNPQEIIGKTITVQYFEETVNKNNDMISLRFPVLKYVYEDGRNV